MGRELLQHSPYSLHLAQSDFRLFGPLSESLRRIKFENNKDVQQHVLELLHDANKDFHSVGFSRLVELWFTKLKGEYVDR